MFSIAQNLQRIRKDIPENVKLVVVSKFKPADDILEAYHDGQRCFGENKAQEIRDKFAVLPKDIEWHFIGHLQSNKIKYIAPFIHLIHSVDSLKLLVEINRAAEKNQRKINCLLQFHIATEESKFGFSYQEAVEMLQSDSFKQLHHVQICGVMGMATFTEDESLIRSEFKTLHGYFVKIKERFFEEDTHFKEISMGMTDDFRIAIEEGSTIVRIGSAIFGKRNYL